jgi:ABC-type multidrug transport system ATPase subunit
MSAIINVRNLTKEFKEVKAVDNLSFTVNTGEVYGFLGQNGAGKSTTIRMLLTLITPSSGTIEIMGMNLVNHRKEILRQVGAIIERPDLYKYLTALENLKIFAVMSGMKITEKQLMEQLDQVGLADRAHSKVKTYSQGMKQRLGLATALVHNPKLIILDEPINGLDPQGIAEVRNLILQLSREQGKTLVISSHLLSEMELIADSMLIIDQGKKVVEGKVNQLFNPAETVMEFKTPDPDAALEKIKGSTLQPLIHGKKADSVVLKLHREQVPEVIRQLVQLDIPVFSFTSKHSLEDYFLSLTKDPHHVEAFTN